MPEYGNVPQDDVQALTQAAQAAARVVDRLPPDVPGDWREDAYEVVLAGIGQDWVQNGTTELDQNDEVDLTDLVRVAADVAREQPPHRRDATFKTLCRAAIQDWVVNWNADEDI